jgi:hypothetical protein
MAVHGEEGGGKVRCIAIIIDDKNAFRGRDCGHAGLPILATIVADGRLGAELTAKHEMGHRYNCPHYMGGIALRHVLGQIQLRNALMRGIPRMYTCSLKAELKTINKRSRPFNPDAA